MMQSEELDSVLVNGDHSPVSSLRIGMDLDEVLGDLGATLSLLRAQTIGGDHSENQR